MNGPFPPPPALPRLFKHIGHFMTRFGLVNVGVALPSWHADLPAEVEDGLLNEMRADIDEVLMFGASIGQDIRRYSLRIGREFGGRKHVLMLDLVGVPSSGSGVIH